MAGDPGDDRGSPANTAMSRSAVVHLTSVHPPDDARIAARECRTLLDAGFPTTLVATDAGRPTYPGLPTRLIGRPASRLIRMLVTPWRVLFVGASLRADVYHLHDPELIPMGLILKLLGKRVVYDAHENLPKQVMGKDWLPRGLRPLAAWIARMIERLADKSFDAIVVANPTSISRFRNGRTVLVRNYADVREFAQADSQTSYRDRPPIIAYVGAISHERGLFEMVDAMGMVVHPDARLVLAGRMPDDLAELASRRRGWERVDAPGWHSRRDVQDLLARSRVGLAVLHPMPNSVDNYPTKLFEYMASGIPSIVSDFPLWREVIEQAECGVVVDPMDPGSIATAIDHFLSDPDGAEAVGQRGRAAVHRTLNWEVEGEKLVELYAELTGSGA